MASMKRHKHAHAALLAVDYPKQNERIDSPSYTIRVSAPQDSKRVGLSIDQGPWKSCRAAAGFWWYDWAGYEDGEHEIIVSMETAAGVLVVSEPHEFFVELTVSLVKA